MQLGPQFLLSNVVFKYMTFQVSTTYLCIETIPNTSSKYNFINYVSMYSYFLRQKEIKMYIEKPVLMYLPILNPKKRTSSTHTYLLLSRTYIAYNFSLMQLQCVREIPTCLTQALVIQLFTYPCLRLCIVRHNYSPQS